jgi:sortase A
MRRLLESLLWAVAAIALTIFALTRAEAWLYQSYAEWKFEASAISAPVVVSNGFPLGRLEIPSIGLEVMFFEGVDARTLRRGIGHIPDTALPGQAGNIALSAHRDTFFRRLGEIRMNDHISITTLAGTYQYTVESIQIVNPDEAIAIRDIGRPVLTLVTCYPFQYAGPAPKRFIVHAQKVAGSSGSQKF